MTVKLTHGCDYELKGTGEVVRVYQAPDNHFWYWESVEERKSKNCTAEDFVRQVFKSYGGIMEIKEGDIVVYLKGGYNTSPSMTVGQVIGFKNARVTVQFSGSTSNLSPNNLLVVTESRLRETYDFIK